MCSLTICRWCIPGGDIGGNALLSVWVTELNVTFNIKLYETNFRSLDPQLGRFWQIDPLADAAYEYSPFAYGNNNPLTFNDPLGLFSDSTGTPGFSPDNPKLLETVTVTTKPKVGSQFLPYIGFPNGRPVQSPLIRIGLYLSVETDVMIYLIVGLWA